MIVIDASVVVLGLLSDGEARRLMMDEVLAVPHLADAEVAHALRSRTRRGAIAEEVGLRALRAWARLEVTRFSSRGLLERAWELRHNISAYDAMYVALAEALDSPLVTADARLSAAPGLCCPITVLPSAGRTTSGGRQ